MVAIYGPWNQQLPKVYSILLDSPDSIVDDTTIERLLALLEETCKDEQKCDKLLHEDTGTLSFLQNSDLRCHPLGFAFALRFAGLLGRYASVHDDVKRIVTEIIFGACNHDLFKTPSIKYAWFLSLTSLCHESSWLSVLEGFRKEVQAVFSSSTLYVQKVAVKFVAHLMISFYNAHLVFPDSWHLSSFLTSELCDAPVLVGWLDVVTQMHQMHAATCLAYLTEQSLILPAIKFIVEQPPAATGSVLDSLVHAFCFIVPRFVSFLEFGQLLHIKCYTGDATKSFILDFLSSVRSCPGLLPYYPELCLSLICGNDGVTVSDDSNDIASWNKDILVQLVQIVQCSEMRTDSQSKDRTVLDESYNAENIIKSGDLSTRRKFLLAVVGTLTKSLSKITPFKACYSVMLNWTSTCLAIIKSALTSQYDTRLTKDMFEAIVGDKKTARVCTAFLKVLLESSMCTMKCEQLITNHLIALIETCGDDSQIMCSCLDLLTQIIKTGSEKTIELILSGSLPILSAEGQSTLEQVYPSDHQHSNKLINIADVLSKRLWDVSWEVKDSCIQVVSALLNQAKDIGSCCLLESNTFWCHIFDMVEDRESFVRATAVAFVGLIPAFSVAWEIFCSTKQLTFLSIVRSMHEIFLDERQKDDIFLRRSILDVLKSWFCKFDMTSLMFSAADEECFLHPFIKIPLCEVDAIREKILEIISDARSDFDWEVRCRSHNVWSSIFRTVKVDPIKRIYSDVAKAKSGISSHSDKSADHKLRQDDSSSHDSQEHAFQSERRTECISVLQSFIRTSTALETLKCICFESEYKVICASIQCLRDCFNMVKRCDHTILNDYDCRQVKGQYPKSDSELDDRPFKRRRSSSYQAVSLPEISEAADVEQFLKESSDFQFEFPLLLFKLNFNNLLENLQPMDEQVKNDPQSLLGDIIASSTKNSDNLLDCY